MSISVENIVEDELGVRGGVYLPPSWHMLKQQIAYLAQFGGSIQVVQGPHGSGKTTLFRWLRDEPIGEDFLSLSASPELELEAFLYDLLWQLGLRPEQSAPIGEYISLLRSYVQSLHQEGARVVVAIDDAHHIPDAALAAIASVLQGGDQTGMGLHLILFGDMGLPEKLDRLQLLDVEVHDSVIPSLSQHEVEQFIFARGLALKDGIEPVKLKQIWYRSKGLPGPILQHFNQSFAADVVANPDAVENDRFLSGNGLPLVHIGAIALLIAVLVWAFFGRNQADSPKIEAQTVQTESRGAESAYQEPLVSGAAGAVKTEAQSTTVSSQADPLTQSSGALVRSEKATASSLSGSAISKHSGDQKIAFVETVESPTQSVSSDSTVVTRLQGATEGAKVNSLENQGAKQASSSAVKGVSASSVSSAESASTAPRNTGQTSAEMDLLLFADAEKVLKAKPASAYSLQLMALSDYQKLRDFADKQPNKKHLMIYRARRNGRTFYILLEGYYADKASAETAIANLPADLRRAKPWPKKVALIQQDIANFR